MSLKLEATAPVVRIRYRQPTDRRSRPKRWADAVATLADLLDDYQAWRDPASLADSAIADRLAADARADAAKARAAAAEGRADRAELGWDGERAHADALRDRIDVMQAQLATAGAFGSADA